MALRLFCLFCFSLPFNFALANDYAYSVPGGGAVATVHPVASRAAADVLQQGGSAADAVIAAAITLGVVDSHNSGIGGGNFAVVRWADGSLEALDGREMAPAKAHRDMYLRNGKADGQLSRVGPLAVGVPGSMAVFDYLHRKGGKKTWESLFLSAADLAEKGVELNQVSFDRIERSAEQLKRFPATASIFLDAEGRPWPLGHRLQQNDLAKTYREIAKEGASYFYRGNFSKQVAAWMAENGGIVSAADFANYRMLKRKPVESQYRGYQVVGFPPPSSGGVHVAQILNILSYFDLASMEEGERQHLMAEAMQLAFADRAHYLGDADFVPVPRGLIDPVYAKGLAASIDQTKHRGDVQYGEPPNKDIDLFSKHTTHIVVADRWGNWVTMTTTINTSFGSKVVVPGTGVLLNNQMDDFSIQPGVPNAFGLVGNEANSIAPGKRPLSSMSPTLVLKGGQPVIAVGAAGGPTIITQVVQALVNVIDFNLSANEALSAQRVHQQWRPDLLFVEESLPEVSRKTLEKKGHKLYARRFAGATQMIVQGAKGEFDAASEPRIIQRNSVAED